MRVCAARSGRSPSRAIETSGLIKTYRKPRKLREFLPHPFRGKRLAALRGLSLTAEWGELHALVGPNGAGKTTLLKLLCTLLLPDRGIAAVGGHDTRRAATQVRRISGLVIADERSFYWRLSGRHNLEFFAQLHGLTVRESEKRTNEVAERLGLSDVLDKPFKEYSTGMRQKLAICRGILNQPRVLLLDEPTRGIDLDTLRALRAYLRTFAADGGTALIASHDLAEIETLDCTVSILDKGQLITSGTLQSLKRELGVADEYLLTLDKRPAIRPTHPGLTGWDPEGGANGIGRVGITLAPGVALGEVLDAVQRAGVVVRTCTPRGGNLEAVLDARRNAAQDESA